MRQDSSEVHVQESVSVCVVCEESVSGVKTFVSEMMR